VDGYLNLQLAGNTRINGVVESIDVPLMYVTDAVVGARVMVKGFANIKRDSPVRPNKSHLDIRNFQTS
jgi:hypothetical protein